MLESKYRQQNTKIIIDLGPVLYRDLADFSAALPETMTSVARNILRDFFGRMDKTLILPPPEVIQEEAKA